MNSIWLAVGAILIFFLGYRFYSRFIADRIYQLDADFKTPAHAYEDGVDFVPTNKWVLWGHHFTSIAGAAPIVGPAIAVYWGWLPAILWVVLGTVFAAGVHDFGTLVLSVRHRGESIGTLTRQIIGERAKNLFLFIILILVLMINAVFAWVISNLFINFPASVISIFIQIPLAIWIGYYSYKRQGNMLIPSILALIAMYGAAVAATYVPVLQIDLVQYFGGEGATGILGLNSVSSAFLIWIVILMLYVYFASTLPVWTLLQPRDYINAHQLVVGLAILYLGLFILAPEVTAPATNPEATEVSWFPLLFITIACGAISGFHGLVSSGTTSKQLDNETDARFVGYMGAVGEGALALITILAVTTYFVSTGEFSSFYNTFEHASSEGLTAFVKGAAHLGTGVFIPEIAARTIVSVIIISFAATTLDTSVRLMRYIIGELGRQYKMPKLTNIHISTGIAVILTALLVLLPEGPKGFGSGGYLLWPLFGTSNQLLAGISLLLVSLWLYRKGRSIIFTAIPMIFLLFMTMWALGQQLLFKWSGFGAGEPNWLLLFFGAVNFVFAIWIVLEAGRKLGIGN